MISVVLICYNQDLSDILFSISSVIHQTGCDYELIISDDHSEEDQRESICSYLDKCGFTKYRYLRADENRGIVMNLLSGVTAASGDIIKMLSPADALYASNTLANIEQFSKTHETLIGFGRLAGYQRNESGFSFFPYEAPLSPEKYNDPTIRCEELLKDQIINTNWVPGCALFYRKDFIQRYLTTLHRDYGIRFGEDLSCPLITKDGTRIAFLDEYVLWYEVGNGITTSGSKSSHTRIYGDHHRFYSKLANDEKTKMYRSALRLFKFRKFIALHTPIYGLAQRLVQLRYMKLRKAPDDRLRRASSFFYSCREMQD